MIKVRHMAQVCRDTIATLHGTLPWEQLNDRQRRLSLVVVNFILANPDATPRSVHNAWMGEMINNEGWQFGVYDEAAKRHPNLVPFEALSGTIVDAYAISIGVVNSLVAIGNRYENCAPSAPEAPAPAVGTVLPPSDGPVTDGGLSLEEIAQLTPTVPSDAQFKTTLGSIAETEVVADWGSALYRSQPTGRTGA